MKWRMTNWPIVSLILDQWGGLYFRTEEICVGCGYGQ